ncbi:MAG: PD-(D/E)XK nuclease family protein [Clostridia bacterium]|nr:PD-(D/E)XK nuclease family protein [Clostridia bacterium]
MIEFVFSKQAASRTEYVIEKLGKALSEGFECVVIIPEQQALYWDTLVARRFLPTDALKVETLSFRRLADSVFRTYGGSAKNYINEAQSTLLMWSAVNSVAPALKAFKATARNDRYVPLFLRAKSELKLYGISPKTIMEASEDMDPALSSLPLRLHDLALAVSAYENLLKESFDDPEEIPDALEKALGEHNWFNNKKVFIDSFYTLTPQEIKVVRRIFSSAADTLITFAMDEDDRGRPHMEYVVSYALEMERHARNLKKDIKKTAINDGRRPVFSYLSKNLWNFAAVPFEGDCSGISLIKCPDRYDEAALVAAKIKSLVADGARFSDIACVSADLESLRGITDIELERHGIPVFVSGKTPVTSQPALRLLLSASEVISKGWKKEDIVACARTGLCALTPDEADALEVYTDKWRIRGKKSYTCSRWDMNADGYTTEESIWGKQLLSLANDAKEKLIPPLEAFSESFPGKVRDILAAAYKLLCDFDVYGHLCRETAVLEAAGKRGEAEKKARVWDAVMQVMDIMESAVGDETADSALFASLLRRTADTCSIATIPDGLDRVVLGDVSGVRTDSVKHLIVLGAKSGEFPRVPKDDGFFNDQDRKELSEAGIEIAPSTVKRQWEEMFRFMETVTSPVETLTLLVPSESSGNHPSTGALRLLKLLPEMETLDFTVPEGETLLRTGKGAEDTLFTSPLSADGDRTTGTALAKLFDRDINLTQTRIECFSACAFQYYCRHILRLSEGETAELKPAEVGTFVHSVLENFMKEAAREKAFPMSDEAVISRTERLISEYAKKVLPESRTEGYVDHLFERITGSLHFFAKALNREFSQSRFEPHSFELKVGFSDDLPAIPIRLENGHDLTVRGIVDRVDILREGGNVYVRVVDYKTGSKTFSLSKVMKGENIQLLLYLFALCNMPDDCSFAKELLPNGERLVPAGAVYFSAKPGDISSDKFISRDETESFALGEISRTGIVLGDTAVIEAMDKELSGEYAPAYLDKKGNLKGSFAETEADFKIIENTITEFLQGVGNRLVTGEAGSCPTGFGVSSPCKWCAMKPLCRHNGHKQTKINEGGESDE